MHRDERPSRKNGVPGFYARVLALLALLLLTPAAARAQWTTTGNNVSNTNTGNVGVGTGTSSPAEKLTVAGSIVAKGSSAIDGSQFIITNNDTTGPWIGVHTDSSGNSTAGYAAARLSMQAAGSFFQLSPTTATGLPRSWTTRLAIASGGNVGIGTTTPGVKLAVAGAINATGAITGATVSAKYQDVAEWVPSTQELAAGTVVVLDTGRTNHVTGLDRVRTTRRWRGWSRPSRA